MNDLPKYVEKDLEVLYNAEFKVSKYGYSYTDYHRMSVKLTNIARKYPEKYLEPVLEFLGYFTDSNEILEEADYRAELQHLAEYYFIEAMTKDYVCYDNVKKQCDFIDLEYIDCIYTNKNRFKEVYESKYPSKVVTMD